MKVAIIISHYNRFEQIEITIDSIKCTLKSVDLEIVVLDDGSDFGEIDTNRVFKYFIQDDHHGKEGHVTHWAGKLEIALNMDAELFIFMPDDFERLDVNKIVKVHKEISSAYAHNIINDGREVVWTGVNPVEVTIPNMPRYKFKRVGFVDCGFFCNKEALEEIDYSLPEVPDWWFDRPDKSSGVGYVMSKQFIDKGVAMYLPNKSLAYHGDHESKMHKIERKVNPLISK